MDGYWQKILRVDLNFNTIKEEKIPEVFLRKLIGGSGFGTKILYDEVSPKVKPFDPENRLIFALGPWQATKLPGGAKWSVISKSPLTGTYGESAAGASWGHRLKSSGYDALIIQGRASRPVYLLIDENGAEIRSAEKLWGMYALDVPEALKEKLGESKLAVVSIGPAGERLVRFACITADGHSFAGRCGLGAVMGSKNLKAIATYGTKDTAVFDQGEVNKLEKSFRKSIGETAREGGLRKYGTPMLLPTSAQTGNLPIKYWKGDVWEGVEKIAPPRYNKLLRVRPVNCLHCPVGCHRGVEITEPAKYVMKGPGPQYETLCMLGSNCLVDDPKAIAKANLLCDQLGLDTISSGACVAFAMECFERRWLTKEKTDGLEIGWGDGDILIELIRKIGLREGVGELFADGSLKAAQKIGKEAEEIIVQVRGLDFPAWDPRAFFGTAVNYATGTRGSCHERGIAASMELGLPFPEIGIARMPEPFTAEGKAYIAAKSQDVATILNSLVICNFMLDGGGLTLLDTLKGFNAITGWNWSIEEFMTAGERIYTLQRLINIRDGMGGSYDRLPKRMFEPSQVGIRAAKVPPLQTMLAEYYRLRGWDHRGKPTKETLKRLEI